MQGTRSLIQAHKLWKATRPTETQHMEAFSLNLWHVNLWLTAVRVWLTAVRVWLTVFDTTTLRHERRVAARSGEAAEVSWLRRYGWSRSGFSLAHPQTFVFESERVRNSNWLFTSSQQLDFDCSSIDWTVWSTTESGDARHCILVHGTTFSTFNHDSLQVSPLGISKGGQSQDVLSAWMVTSWLPPQFSFSLVPSKDDVFLNFGVQSLACCGYPHATSQRPHSKRFGTCWKHRSVMSRIQKAALHLDGCPRSVDGRYTGDVHMSFLQSGFEGTGWFRWLESKSDQMNGFMNEHGLCNFWYVHHLHLRNSETNNTILLHVTRMISLL